MIAFVFAYDCAELLVATSLPNRVLPKLVDVKSDPSVALVCCTCDDIDPEVLSKLGKQTYVNLRVFVLDDSQQPAARALVDCIPYTIVRRSRRSGFKAGNLNHWLRRYGEEFDYVTVADADSILPPTFVADMVAHLEHPGNAHIGILESCIQPWNVTNTFARLLGLNAMLNRLLLLRVASRLGATLSVGHNNLIRICALLEVGGFDEDYLAEDYAVTIALLRTGARTCEAADVTSFEHAFPKI
jgi:cellulose synthase/poly-beta-1,6-N-acetylglucosamine synthase-like glycosyltransferase